MLYGRPASSSMRPGWPSRVSDQGASSTIGVTISAAKRSRCGTSNCRWPRANRQPSTTAASTSAIGQVTGVNAVVKVSISASTQVARQPGRAPRSIAESPSRSPAAAAAARAISGSRIASTAVPRRPAASAPVTAGRKAYATDAQARSSRDSTSGREAK